jgi:hypothetical protein
MLAPKSDFIGLEGITHLATGGQPPLLKAQRQAFEAYAEHKARGFPGYYAHLEVAQEVRRGLAAMTGLARMTSPLSAAPRPASHRCCRRSIGGPATMW